LEKSDAEESDAEESDAQESDAEESDDQFCEIAGQGRWKVCVESTVEDDVEISDEDPEQPFGCSTEEIEQEILEAFFPPNVLFTEMTVFISSSNQRPKIPDLAVIRYICIPINQSYNHFMAVYVDLKDKWFARMGMNAIPQRIAEWLTSFCEFASFEDKSPNVCRQEEEECGGRIVVYARLLFIQKIGVDVPLQNTTFYQKVQEVMQRWRSRRSESEVRRQIGLHNISRKRGRPCFPTFPTPALVEYELQRQVKIRENNDQLRKLGLERTILKDVEGEENKRERRGRPIGSTAGKKTYEKKRQSTRVAALVQAVHQAPRTLTQASAGSTAATGYDDANVVMPSSSATDSPSARIA